jgi:hypothetical protein
MLSAGLRLVMVGPEKPCAPQKMRKHHTVPLSQRTTLICSADFLGRTSEQFFGGRKTAFLRKQSGAGINRAGEAGVPSVQRTDATGSRLNKDYLLATVFMKFKNSGP